MNPSTMVHIATICQNEQLMAYVYMIPANEQGASPTIITSYVGNKITKHTNEVTVKQSLNNLFDTEQIGDTWVPVDIRAFRVNAAGYCSYSYVFDYPILEVRWSDIYTKFGVLEFNLIDIRKLFLSDDEIIAGAANVLKDMCEETPKEYIVIYDSDSDADDADDADDEDMASENEEEEDEEEADMSDCSECNCNFVYSILVEPPNITRMEFTTPTRTTQRTTPPSLNRKTITARRSRLSPRTLFPFRKPATNEPRRSDRIAAKNLRRSSRLTKTKNPYKI